MDLGNAELDRLLSESRRMLESLRSSRGLNNGDEARGIGVSADGRVRATAVGGQLDVLELDPRVMRMASDELAEQVVAAVNAALSDLAAKAPPADGTVTIDPQVLAVQVAEIQDEGKRQMAAISQAVSAAMARVREAVE